MTRHVRAVWTRLQCNSLSYIQRLNNESFTEPTSYRLTPIEPPQAMANVLGLSRCWITNIWTKNSVSVSLLTVRFKHIESTSVACNDLISNLRCENGAGDDLRTDLYKRESTRFPFSGKKLNHHQMCSMCSVSFALYDDCSLARNQSPLRHDFSMLLGQQTDYKWKRESFCKHSVPLFFQCFQGLYEMYATFFLYFLGMRISISVLVFIGFREVCIPETDLFLLSLQLTLQNKSLKNIFILLGLTSCMLSNPSANLWSFCFSYFSTTALGLTLSHQVQI